MPKSGEVLSGWDEGKYLLICVEGEEVLRIDSSGNLYAMGMHVTRPDHMDAVLGAAKSYAKFCNKTRNELRLPPGARRPTSSQLKVLLFIQEQVKDRGFPPTVREISSNFGWSSTNACAEHLLRLARKGMLEVTPGVSRGIKVTLLAEVYLQGLLPAVGEVE